MPLLAGQETDVGEEVGIVVLVPVVVVALAKGAKDDEVENTEERIVVPAKAMVEVLKIVVELATMDKMFNGTDTLRGKELAAVVRGTGTLVVVFKGNEILVDAELTAVVMGNAILDKFDEAKGDEVADAEVELDTALETSGGLGDAEI